MLHKKIFGIRFRSRSELAVWLIKGIFAAFMLYGYIFGSILLLNGIAGWLS